MKFPGSPKALMHTSFRMTLVYTCTDTQSSSSSQLSIRSQMKVYAVTQIGSADYIKWLHYSGLLGHATDGAALD